jgi:hypothetical protein
VTLGRVNSCKVGPHLSRWGSKTQWLDTPIGSGLNKQKFLQYPIRIWSSISGFETIVSFSEACQQCIEPFGYVNVLRVILLLYEWIPVSYSEMVDDSLWLEGFYASIFLHGLNTGEKTTNFIVIWRKSLLIVGRRTIINTKARIVEVNISYVTAVGIPKGKRLHGDRGIKKK